MLEVISGDYLLIYLMQRFLLASITQWNICDVWPIVTSMDSTGNKKKKSLS